MELKISDLTPSGVNVANEDLFVISEFTTGPIYTSKSVTGLEVKRASNLWVVNNVSVDYLITALDEHGFIVADCSSANVTVTFPEDAVIDFPIGTEIRVMSKGSGNTVYIAAAMGVVINSIWGFIELAGTYGVVSMVKIGINEWTLSGDLM